MLLNLPMAGTNDESMELDSLNSSTLTGSTSRPTIVWSNYQRSKTLDTIARISSRFSEALAITRHPYSAYKIVIKQELHDNNVVIGDFPRSGSTTDEHFETESLDYKHDADDLYPIAGGRTLTDHQFGFEVYDANSAIEQFGHELVGDTEMSCLLDRALVEQTFRTTFPDILSRALNYCTRCLVKESARNRTLHLSQLLASQAEALADQVVKLRDLKRDIWSTNHSKREISNNSLQYHLVPQLSSIDVQHKPYAWVLNLSMHSRDWPDREKFFVTYIESRHKWRRVTISICYDGAEADSLEIQVRDCYQQRAKFTRICESIQASISDISFYDTVTNLKLETHANKLNVHVTEDARELISYPSLDEILYLPKVPKYQNSDVIFVEHLSGFVYNVHCKGTLCVLKQIPGPDSIAAFLYEMNALSSLRSAPNVVDLLGIVVEYDNSIVTGLIVAHAARGSLVDILYEYHDRTPWDLRQKWAHQIVRGLYEIHQAGLVHGDFTLSNIVIDDNDDAKIIDLNRRGCSVGWEPPELLPQLESHQSIAMYMGEKTDVFQLGMVLWAVAMQEDEPEKLSRPLPISALVDSTPVYFKDLVSSCLTPQPRFRPSTPDLVTLINQINSNSGDVKAIPRIISDADPQSLLSTSLGLTDLDTVRAKESSENLEFELAPDEKDNAGATIRSTPQKPTSQGETQSQYSSASSSPGEYNSMELKSLTQCLIKSIRRFIFPNSREWIEHVIGHHRKTPFGPCEVQLFVMWDVISYLKSQILYEGETKENFDVLRKVLTVSGSASKAYATTIEDYLALIRQGSGINILDLIIELLQANVRGMFFIA